MPFSSPASLLFSNCLLFSLVSLLFLLLFSSSAISATSNNSNTSSTSREALSSTHPHQKCIHEHLSALLQLKRRFDLNHSHTKLLSSWNANNTACCSWEGITCDTSTGHVIGLDLTGNDFDGSPIPSGFGQLSSLTHLHLFGCNFNGQILPDISRLTRLVSLDLSYNHISSPVPQFIANFTSLTSLHLIGCGLHGDFPKSIFSLQKLETVDISFNQFLTVYLPKFWTNSTIQQLTVSGTEFHVNLADFLGNFKSLTDLDLSSCNISGPITQSHLNLTQLVNLDLSNNNIQGPIPTFIFYLTQLRVLSLSSNNFSGVIDLSLFHNLRNLEELHLSHNHLSAVINTRNSLTSNSQSCVNLSQLVQLDLSKNNFQGPIPRPIFELTGLTDLELSSNNFSGVIDIGSFQNLKNLEELHLSHNSFSSLINVRKRSQSFGNNSQLVRLYLANNNFQGPIPKPIFELTELTDLDLSSNNFSGVMDLGLFQNFTNLSFLDLSHNSLTVVHHTRSNSTSTSFPQLRDLRLRSCNISKFPDMLRNQEEMSYLDLSCNGISGKIPEWIWAVGDWSLYSLNLSNNALEGLEVPFPHLSLSGMQYLDLSANRLKGLTLIPPASSFFFSIANNTLHGEVPSLFCNATFLQVLDLSSNHFTGPIPQCLGEISDALIVLNLRKNAFRGPLLQFKAGCLLQTLDLSDNQLEGQMPKSLANCQKLKVVNIGNNHIQDSFPSQLGNLSNLRVLVLRSNKFYGSIGRPSTSQAFFSQLQIIDVSFNNFNGRLPSNLFSSWKMMKDGGSASEFLTARSLGGRYYQDRVILVNKGNEIEFAKILIAFTVLDLSQNQFHGDIPSSIGELKSLHLLNMSHNHFQGIIPTSLGNLRDLESLDLSQNRLHGNIPWQLTKLSFLAVLNLSQNQLIGSIPQDRQFHTFENDSFLGNPGLCGRPLSTKCKENATSTPSRQSENKSELDLMWIGFGVGHAVGFGIFFWTLVLWRKARHAFFMFVDRMLLSFSSFAKCSGV